MWPFLVKLFWLLLDNWLLVLVAVAVFTGGILLARLSASRKIEALQRSRNELELAMYTLGEESRAETYRTAETIRSLENKVALQVHELSMTDNDLRRENQRLQADNKKANAELDRVRKEEGARLDHASQENDILKATIRNLESALELESRRRR